MGLRNHFNSRSEEDQLNRLKKLADNLSSRQISRLQEYKKETAMNESTMSNPGIIITIILLLLPILLGIVIMILKVMGTIRQAKDHQQLEDADKLAEYLGNLSKEELEEQLVKEKRHWISNYRTRNYPGKCQQKTRRDSFTSINLRDYQLLRPRKSLTTPQY